MANWLGRLFGGGSKAADSVALAIPAGTDLQKMVTDAIREVAAGMDGGLQNLAAGLGTYRDKSYYSEYGAVTRLNEEEVTRMYRGSWIPRKIVDCVTEDMTREWVTLSFGSGQKTDQGAARAVAETEKNLNVRREFAHGIRWGRAFGGGGMVMRLRNDGAVLEQPLNPESIKKGDLVLVKTYDRFNLVVDGTEIDNETTTAAGKTNPNFGLPKFYTVIDVGGGQVNRIHASRVIRFGGAVTPRRAWISNGYWDDSVLLAPMQAIRNYDAATGGIASMVFETKLDIISVAGLTNALATKDGEAKITARFLAGAIMKSLNKILLIDKDKEAFAQKQITFTGLKDVLEGMMNALSGAADVPLTRLFGQSPGGMNATGDSDMRNHYDHIKGRQTSDVRPQLSQFHEVEIRSALGTMPPETSFEFNPLWQQTAKEKADTEKVRADTRKVYWDIGALNEGGVARELHADGSMKTMTDRDVTLAEELAQQPEPEPPAFTPAKTNVPPAAR
jgi:hypothetical protein